MQPAVTSGVGCRPQAAEPREHGRQRRDIWRAEPAGGRASGVSRGAGATGAGRVARIRGGLPQSLKDSYSLESWTLLALSRRRGLRGRELLPRGVGRPVAGAAPPPAGILGLPPAGHSGGGGGRSGPAAVPTSPQNAAARGPCRRRRRRRRRHAGPGLVRSRVGRCCLAPFLVLLLLRGSRLLRLPRHRGSSVPHPCVPGGGGGGARGAAPPAPLGSRRVPLPLTPKHLSSPPHPSEGAPPPTRAPCHSSPRPPAARTRAPAEASNGPIGKEDRPPGPAPHGLGLRVAHSVPSPTPPFNQSGNGSEGEREVSFPARPFSPLNGCVSRQSQSDLSPAPGVQPQLGAVGGAGRARGAVRTKRTSARFARIPPPHPRRLRAHLPPRGAPASSGVLARLTSGQDVVPPPPGPPPSCSGLSVPCAAGSRGEKG